ncbi:MAG: HAMP domain-containing protein [Opitutae bacterium]|nr:HAMP domain-containing protein [Opitutae bacterium]
MSLLRFRRFSTRVLLLIAGLVAVSLLTVYGLVARANRLNAVRHIEQNLERGARLYREAVSVRIEILARSGSQMANDYAFRQMLLREHMEPRTIRSALLNSSERIGAPVIALFTPSGDLIANTREELSAEHCGPFRYLIQKATETDTVLVDGRYASDFAYLDGRLHVLVIVPLYAPSPEIVNWFGFAFPIDDDFASRIKSLANLDVTFTSAMGHDRARVLATTLNSGMAADVATHHEVPGSATSIINLAGEPYVTSLLSLPLLGDDPAHIILQRSLNEELAFARDLEGLVLKIALTALAATMLAALAIARGVSQPVQALAAHIRHVAAGDYTKRIELRREDELGQLATAFNQMTVGLAERDRTRDLLGKVVSPEIAAQLLRSDLQLGGEEREVTILFADLRNFTTLSEPLPPAEVLALLNRFLDRMSTVVEKHGGVIDKYIGDSIMALFGAPVADPEAADRAVAAARAMLATLAELNWELVAEGKPALVLGIGINTARVVAGNIGSQTRLNYTVIGDGVNIASRLESLTKEPSYGTHIIVSEATAKAAKRAQPLRPLGEVTVKGKSAAVQIYAAD